MEQTQRPVRDVLTDGARQLGLSLTTAQSSALLTYLDALSAWNRKVNLTAILDEEEIIVKHFLDSLAGRQALAPDRGVSLLDIGSGAGFPGLPLKIVQPELIVTLLEPNEKKIAFLRHVIGTLRLRGVSVVSQRVEAFARAREPNQPRVAHIVTRALSLDVIVPHLDALLAEPGRVILFRSRPIEDDEENVTSARAGRLVVTSEIAFQLPFGYGPRVLTILERKGGA